MCKLQGDGWTGPGLKRGHPVCFVVWRVEMGRGGPQSFTLR